MTPTNITKVNVYDEVDTFYPKEEVSFPKNDMESEVIQYDEQSLTSKILEEMRLESERKTLVKNPGCLGNEVLYKCPVQMKKRYDPVIGFKGELEFVSRYNGPKILTTFEILMESQIIVKTNYQLLVIDSLLKTLSRCNREQYSATYGKVFGVRLEDLPQFLLSSGIQLSKLPQSIQVIKGKKYTKPKEKAVVEMMTEVMLFPCKYPFETFVEFGDTLYSITEKCNDMTIVPRVDPETFFKEQILSQPKVPKQRQMKNVAMVEFGSDDQIVFEEQMNVKGEKESIGEIYEGEPEMIIGPCWDKIDRVIMKTTEDYEWHIKLADDDNVNHYIKPYDDEDCSGPVLCKNYVEVEGNIESSVDLLIRDPIEEIIPPQEVSVQIKHTKPTARHYLKSDYNYNWSEIEELVKSFEIDERNIIYGILSAHFGSLAAIIEEINRTSRGDFVLLTIEEFWVKYGKKQKHIDKLVYVCNSLRGVATFDIQDGLPKTLIPEGVRAQFSAAYEMVAKFATEGVFSYLSATINKLIATCKQVLSLDLMIIMLIVFYCSIIAISFTLPPDIAVLLVGLIGELLSKHLGSTMLKSIVRLGTSLQIALLLQECSPVVQALGFVWMYRHMFKSIHYSSQYGQQVALRRTIKEIEEMMHLPDDELQVQSLAFAEKHNIAVEGVFREEDGSEEGSSARENFTIALDEAHGDFNVALVEKLVPKNIFDNFGLSSFRKVGGFSRDFLATTTAGAKIFEYVGGIILWIVKAVNMKVFGTCNMDEFLPAMKSEGEKLSEDYTQFQKYRDSDTTPGVFTSDKLEEKKNYRFNTAVQLLNRVRNFRQKLLLLKRAPTPFVSNYFNEMEKQLNGYLIGNEASFTVVPSKIEPVVLWLNGRPGAGKTMCVDELMKYVYLQMGEQYDPAYDKYAKPESTDFWEGYHSQKVFLMDDFCQSKNVNYRHRILAEFISLTTTATAPLNFAALENKGTSFFNSEAIVITSNAELGELNVADLITSPEALARRVTAYVVVESPKTDDFDIERATFSVRKPIRVAGFKEDVVQTLNWQQFRRFVLSLFRMNRAINRERIEMYAQPVEHDDEAEKYEDSMDKIMNLIPSKFKKIHNKRKMARRQVFDEVDGHVIAVPAPPLVEEIVVHEFVNEDNEAIQYTNRLFLTVFFSIFSFLCFLTSYFTSSVKRIFDSTINSGVRSIHAMWDYPMRALVKSYLSDLVNMGLSAILTVVLAILVLLYVLSSAWQLIVSAIVGFAHMIKSALGFSKSKTDEYNEEGKNGKWNNRRHNVNQRRGVAAATSHGDSGLPSKQNDMPTGQFEFNAASTMDSSSKIKFHCVICEQFVEMRRSDYRGETCNSCRRRKSLDELLKKVNETTNHPCNICGEDMELGGENDKYCAKCSILNENGLEIGEYKIVQQDSAFARVKSRLRENLGLIEVEFSDGTIKETYGLVTHANCVVTVWHLFRDKKVSRIVFRSRKGDYTVQGVISVKQIARDAAMFLISSPMFRDIRKHFITRNSDPKIFDGRTLAIVHPENMSYGRCRLIKGFRTILASGECTYENAVTVSVPTVKGDCGLPYVVWGSDLGEERILGVHSLGSGDKMTVPMAVCEILFRECLYHPDDQGFKEEALEMVLPRAASVVDVSLPGCVLIGRLPSNCRGQYRSDSKLLPVFSAQELWQPKKKPSPCGSLDALKLGVNSAFSCDKSDVHPAYVLMAERHCLETINRFPTIYSEEKRILTISEAIGGVSINGILDPYIQPMKISTSPGFIYRDIGPGKTALLYRDDVDRLCAYPEIHQIIENKLLLMKNKIIPSTFWLDSLKDEKLAIEKVEKGKARVFSNGQFDMNVIVRMYFGQFIAHLCANHISGECSVGINTTSEDDTTLFYSLLSRNGRLVKFLAGDYSKYDKRLPFQMINSFVNVVNAWYGDQNGDMRKAIMFATFNGYRIAERDVYKQLHGMPSGTPLTAPANSIINGLMFRVVMLDLAIKNESISHITELPLLFDALECRFYGDDNIIAVPDGMEWFNMFSVKESMMDIFGLEYTTADKQDVDKPYYDISEISYLKRTFHFKENVVQMRLDMDSIRESPLWVPGALTPILAQSIIDSMAVQLSLYPVEDYNATLRPLLKAWGGYGVSDPGYRATRLFVNADYGFDQESGEFKTRINEIKQESLKREFILPLVVYGISQRKNNEPLGISAFPKEKTCTQKKIIDLIDFNVCNITLNLEEQSGSSDEFSTNQTVMPENTASLGEAVDNDECEKEITNFVENEMCLKNRYIPFVTKTTICGPAAPSITDFMSRPYKVWSKTINSNDKGRLAVLYFPETLLQKPPIWDKARNFRYMRSDLTFRLLVNATKFHFGKMLLRWVPMGHPKMIAEFATENNPHDNIVSRYPLQGVDAVIKGSGTYEFSVKYVHINPAVSIVDRPGVRDPNDRFGALEIWVQNRVGFVGPTEQSLSCSLYANFDNAELFGPTHIAAPIATYANYLTPYPDFAFQDVQTISMAFEQQAGEETKNKSESGLLSSALDRISQFAALFSMTPTYGPIATMGSAVAGAGAAVARYFGYGIPMSIKAPTPIISSNFDYQYVSGLRNGGYLANTPEHELNPAYDYFGTSMSDMAITSIIAREAPMRMKKIQSDVGEGVLVDVIGLDPFNAHQTGTLLLNPVKFYTPLSFISNLFWFWRGTIRLRYEFVASDFISMRFRLVWCPSYDGNVPTVMPIDDMPNAVSSVITVNGYTNYEIEVPYLCSTYMSSGSIGKIALYTESIASNPGSGASFYINVYVSGCDDFKFGSLNPNGNMMGEMYKPTITEMEEQSGETKSVFTKKLLEDKACKNIGRGFLGEEYTSIKQIANRYSRIPTGVTSSSALVIAPLSNILHPNIRSLVKDSLLAIVSQLYRFRRGGVVIKNIKARNSSPGIGFETGTFMDTTGVNQFVEARSVVASDLELDFNRGYCSGNVSSDGCYEIALPMVGRQLAAYNEFSDSSIVHMHGPIYRTRNWVGPGTGYFAMAPTDDTSFHIFMGAPCARV